MPRPWGGKRRFSAYPGPDTGPDSVETHLLPQLRQRAEWPGCSVSRTPLASAGASSGRSKRHWGGDFQCTSKIKAAWRWSDVQDAMNDYRTASLSRLYMVDIHWNCGTIKRHFEGIEAWLARDQVGYSLAEPDGFVLLDPEFQRSLITIIMAASSIRSLIRPSTQRSKSETNAAYQYRLERFRILQSALDGIDISEIYNTGVRNALEHFDEKLDELIRTVQREPESEYRSKAYNTTFSDELLLQRNIPGLRYPLTHIRTYSAKSGEFIVFNQRINIRKLAKEAELIQQRIAERFGVQEDSGQTGSIIK